MFLSDEPCQEQVKGHPSELCFDLHTNIRHESLLGIRTIALWIALLFLLALCHHVGGMLLLAGLAGAFLEAPTELFLGRFCLSNRTEQPKSCSVVVRLPIRTPSCRNRSSLDKTNRTGLDLKLLRLIRSAYCVLMMSLDNL